MQESPQNMTSYMELQEYYINRTRSLIGKEGENLTIYWSQSDFQEGYIKYP